VRGDDLKCVTSEADAKLALAQRATRAAATVKRRNEIVAADAGLQSQLRAEAQAGRGHAAASEKRLHVALVDCGEPSRRARMPSTSLTDPDALEGGRGRCPHEIGNDRVVEAV